MAVIFSQPNNNQNRIFARSRQSAFRYVLALALSIVLMISDYHYRYLDNVRVGLSLLVTPLQYVVDYPLRVISWVGSLFSSKKT